MTTVDRHDAGEHTPAGGGIETFAASTLLGGLGVALAPRALGRAAAATVRNPAPFVGGIARLTGRLAAVALTGRDEGVEALDNRFADPAWHGNPLFHRLAAGYLTICDATMAAVDELDVDWRVREQVRMSVDNALALAAPTNNMLLNPQVWKEILDTGGASVIRGAQHVLADWRTPAKLPASVDRSGFALGSTIAATPGKVVRRETLYELIEYAPLTDTVDAIPTLIIASPVNKFYLVDLAPERSVIAAELRAGRRVFVVSWVNPDRTHADSGFDDYAAAVVEAMETACRIVGSTSCHPMGLCGGGQLTLLAAAYLASTGRQHLMATLTIAIAVVDFSGEPSGSAYIDRATVGRAIQKARKAGHFNAVDTARSFALLRPVDGIWHPVVHRYLLGRAAPRHDLLFWAADQTNMSAQFGADMLTAALDNSFAVPDRAVVCGVPVDAGKISVPTYVLGASTDHISPWHDCYRTVAMIGDNAEFTLATGGHAAAIAKGPGSKRASYHTGGPAFGVDADTWLSRSEQRSGSWWEHWNEWIARHAPETVAAPDSAGSAEFPPIDDAPGHYVRRVLT
ncbi:MAG: hypothetical protein QM662_13655 [Gordonia sp. (in: high G+C Gram-positive bacteria)]